MVASISSAVKMRIYLDLDAVSGGTGPVLLGGMNANDPGFGQGASPGAAGIAQTLRVQVAEQVLGVGGSIVLADISDALVQAAADVAGASGTPLITAAILAQINGWATGNP